MILPSQRNNYTQQEQHVAFGGGLMKRFLHNQFDSPYYIDEKQRFENIKFSNLDKIIRDNEINNRNRNIEKKRIQQLERNKLWYPKSERQINIRFNPTYFPGIPVNPLNQQPYQHPQLNNYSSHTQKQEVRILNQIGQLIRCQNLLNKQQPFNILTGAGRSMLVQVPEEYNTQFKQRIQQNQHQQFRKKAEFPFN